MKLYHGTNFDFEQVDINKSNPYKDFGQGFYLTDIFRQAEALACKKARLFGGTPVVQTYEFDEVNLEDDSLKILIFERPVKEWAEFIYQNRNKHISAYKHDYDIVVGPIADDGVAYLLSRFEEGSFTLEELAKEVDGMTQYLVDDFKLDIVSALNIIYTSDTYALVQDKETELYIQSPSYLYELLKKEYLTAS